MDNMKKKLLSGTAIYFVGNALASLLSLILLRFITGRVPSEEYGLYNLIVTISNLVTPFVTLQITDAVFKFLIKAEDENERKSVFSVAIAIFLVGFVFVVAGVILIDRFFISIPHSKLVAGYLISTNFYALYHRVIRAFGKNKVYVVCNLTRTFMSLVLQIALIYCFNLGVEALLLATILADIIFAILAETQIHSLRLLSIKSIKASTFKAMLRFSAPLIPNTAFWWLTSSVNSLIVSFRCGLDINGIYTTANKFSAVLALVTNVFIMSWQELAVSEYGKKDFKRFFTNTFNMYTKVVACAISMLIPLMRVVFPIMIDESYYASIQYAPFLLAVSGIATLSGFLSQIFVGQGKTSRNLWTTVIGMIFNIVVVFALVDHIGLWAAVWGSMAADMVIFLLRLFLVRDEFEKSVQFGKIALALLVLMCNIYIYTKFGIIINIICFAISVLIAWVLNHELVKDIFTMIGSLFRKKKSKGDLIDE